MAYGTLVSLDTLATTNNTTVADFGEDTVFATLQSNLDAHNEILDSLLVDFVDRSTDRLRRYGGNSDMLMEELDEMGTPDAQKISVGSNVGFPLKKYGGALQWTRLYLKNAMVSEVAAQFTAMMAADVRNVQKAIKTAFFNPTNYTFTDKLVDRVQVGVKALVNADGAEIPTGPNGETYNGASHTHYLARAGGSMAVSDVTAALETVIEHYSQGEPLIYINRAQEAAFRAFTTADFVPYLYANVTPGISTLYANGTLDALELNNRAIGVYHQAEVWVKPWVPANYILIFMKNAPKPLVMRTRNANSGGLELIYEDETHPLRAKTYEREFGLGVWNRTNGAALYIGDTTYAAPTL